MSEKPKYWFPAKKLGWGWGVPTVWQGRAVFIIFFVLLGAGALAILPTYSSIIFFAYSWLLCAILILICWLKGEPPKWRKG